MLFLIQLTYLEMIVMQRYFAKEYKDKLFNSQAEWEYLDSSEVEDALVGYFEDVSDGKGDVEQFLVDMKSSAVRKRLNYEQKLGESVNLTGTPMFRIDGETIELKDLISTIEARLEG